MSPSSREFHSVQLDQLRSNYKHFKSLIDGPRGVHLWQALNAEESFQKMQWATDDLGLPAVAGVVRVCQPLIDAAPLSEQDRLKQGIGAMVCAIMKANGYEKTGTKKAVPPIEGRRVFRVGEVYRRTGAGVP